MDIQALSAVFAIQGVEWVTVMPWAAFLTLAGALVVAYLNRRSQVHDRRRALYSEAYLQPLRWIELLYRVRRRSAGEETALRATFHDVQERIHYFEGWLYSESPALARSYCKFVGDVRNETKPLIRDAWLDEPHVVGQSMDDLDHPKVPDSREAFLRDISDHLSPWPCRRLAMRGRNKEEKT